MDKWRRALHYWKNILFWWITKARFNNTYVCRFWCACEVLDVDPHWDAFADPVSIRVNITLHYSSVMSPGSGCPKLIKT